MFSVIFDMDGTLLDTQRICIPAWDHAGNKQGFKGVGEHIRRVCGMNEAGWTRYLEDNFPGMDTVLFKREMRDYIIKNGVVRFKEGAEELLKFLKEKGIKIAIASGSSRESINHHLKEVGADGCFDALVGGRDVEKGKPFPDIFLKVAELISADPKDCFVIEDSSNGIRAGYAAGMKCIGVPDIAPFEDGVKGMIFKESKNLLEVIDVLKDYI